MYKLIMSDPVKYTISRDIYNLFSFLKEELRFDEMKVSFADNDNPLSFTVVLIIDDLPEVRYSTINRQFSDNHRQKILKAIEVRIAERDLQKDVEDDLKYNLSTKSPPSYTGPDIPEIEF